MDLKQGLRDESYSAYMSNIDGMVGEKLASLIEDDVALMKKSQQVQLIRYTSQVFESPGDIAILEAHANEVQRAALVANGTRVLALARSFQGCKAGSEWCNRPATWLDGRTPLNYVANGGDIDPVLIRLIQSAEGYVL